MNIYNINDENFINSKLYQEFINKNPSTGSLKIRASAANNALPISGIKIEVSTIFNNNKIIFFEGLTNNSGIIEKITLPAPKLDPNNLDVPNKTTYEIKATYIPDNLIRTYEVNLYENIYVIQNINVIPNSNNQIGDI